MATELETYEKKYQKEIFKLAMEDYAESFTPGKEMPEPNEPIMLPVSWYREKSHIVMAKLARLGVTPPKDFDPNSPSNAFYGDIGSYARNPSTPKIPAEMYEAMDYFKKFFSTDEGKREFKAVHAHLTGLYMRKRMSLTPRDFEIKGAGEDAIRTATLNQYRRYVAGMILSEVIRLAFDVEPSAIETVLKNTGVLDMPTKKLQSSAMRQEFAKGIGSLVKAQFGNQNLGAVLSSQVVKK